MQAWKLDLFPGFIPSLFRKQDMPSFVGELRTALRLYIIRFGFTVDL